LDQVTHLSPHFNLFYYYYILFQARFLIMLVVEETARPATSLMQLAVSFVILAEQGYNDGNDVDNVSSSVLFGPHFQ
jgi:hypothetical protein